MPVQLRIGPKLMLALAGLPAVDERIEALRQSYAAEPDVKPAELERLSDGWADFKRLVRTGLDPQDEAQEQAMTRQAVAIIDPITTQVAELAAHEVERARESQEQAEATYQATRWRVLGIAAIPDDAADADILIRAADRALYAAKGNGRNRVELFISPARSARTPA